MVHAARQNAPERVITAPPTEDDEKDDNEDRFVTTDAGADAEVPDAEEQPTDWDAYRPAQVNLENILASRRHAYESAEGDSGKAGPGGTHGGWGGRGWGFGAWGEGVKNYAPIIKGNFAFGGAVGGAFTGVVCAIPEGIGNLGQIKGCAETDLIGKFGTNEFNVSSRKFTDGFPGLSGRNEWFAIEYTGKVRVTKEGTYTFRLLSDDGARLVIDGELVIDNDGTHGPTSKSGETFLPVGQHPLRLDYFQGPRWDLALQLFVTPPGGEERLFGPVLP